MIHIDNLGRISASSASYAGSSGSTYVDDLDVDPNGDTVWIGKTQSQKWGRQTASTTLSDGQQTSGGGFFRMFNHISHDASDTFSWQRMFLRPGHQLLHHLVLHRGPADRALVLLRRKNLSI